MRTWSRATFDTECGLCRQAIPRGAPVLRITAPSMTRALLRCSACREAPPDLPPLVERAPLPATPLVRFTPDMLPLDWKARQAGAREPGEEG